MKSLVSSSDENASDQESSMDKYAIYSKDNNKVYELKNSGYMKKKIISAIKKSLKSNNNKHSLTLNDVSVSEEKEIGNGCRQSLNIRIALDDKLFYSSGDPGGPMNIETFKLNDSTPATKCCSHCSGTKHETEDDWPAYFSCVKCARKEKRKWYHENCKEKCCTTTSIYCDNCLRFKLTSIDHNFEVLDNKFAKYMYVVTCPNGGGLSLHMDYEKIMNFTQDEQNVIAKEFLKEAFKEDKKGFAQFTIAIVHNGASYMPDLLKLLAELHPTLPVKTTKLKCNTETEVMDLGTYYTKVKETYSNGTFAFNPLNEIQAASVKNDESGAYLPELLSLLEKSAFLTQVLPWSDMTTKRFKSPHESDDGPIFWCRPGEQIVSLDRNSKRNRWNADEIETFLKERQQNLKDFCEKRYIVEELKKYRRSYSSREFLFEDRTRPHADQVWGNHFECTAAVGVIQAIHPDEIPEQNRACKEIVVFHAKHFEMLEALLHIDVTAAPKQQCAEWLDDAKLNMIRQMNIKYSKLHLYDNDIYFIPRKIVHQFKTISATLSVAWHTRLIEYYLEPDPPPVSEPADNSETASASAGIKGEPLSDHDDDSSSSCSSDSLPPPAKKRKTPTATPKKKRKPSCSRSTASTDNEATPRKRKKPRSRSCTPQKRAAAEKTPKKRAPKTPKKVLVLEEEDEDIKPPVAPAPSQQHKKTPEVPPQPVEPPPQSNDSATSSRSESPVAAAKTTENRSRSRSPPATKKRESDASSRSGSPVTVAKPRKKKSRSRSPPATKKRESDASSRSGSPVSVAKPRKKKSRSKSPPPTKKRESDEIDTSEPSKKKKHRSRSRSRSKKRSDAGIVEKDRTKTDSSEKSTKKKKKDRSRSKSPKKNAKSRSRSPKKIEKSKDGVVSSSGSNTVKNDTTVTPSKSSKKSSHSSSSKKHTDSRSKSPAGPGEPEKHRKKHGSDKEKKSRSDPHRSDSSPKGPERETTPPVTSTPDSQSATPAKDGNISVESHAKSPPSSIGSMSTEKCPSPSFTSSIDSASPSCPVPSAVVTEKDKNIAEISLSTISSATSSPSTVVESEPAPTTSSPPPEPEPEEAMEVDPEPEGATEVEPEPEVASVVEETSSPSPAQAVIQDESISQPVPEPVSETTSEKGSDQTNHEISVKSEPLDDVASPATTTAKELPEVPPAPIISRKDLTTSIPKTVPEKPVKKSITGSSADSTIRSNKDHRNKEKLWDTPLFMPQDCDKYEWTKRSSSNPVVSNRVTTKNGDKIVKQKTLDSLQHNDKSEEKTNTDKNNTANNASVTAKTSRSRSKSPPPWIKKREKKILEESTKQAPLTEQKKPTTNSPGDKRSNSNATIVEKDRSSDKHRDKEKKSSEHKRSKDSNSYSRKDQDKSEQQFDKKKSSHSKESGGKSSSGNNSKTPEKSHTSGKDHSHEKRKRSRSPPSDKHQHRDKYSSSSSKKHKKHRSRSRDRSEAAAEKTKSTGNSSKTQNTEQKEEKTTSATPSTGTISLKNVQDAELAANYKLMIPCVQIVDIGAKYKKNVVQDTQDSEATSDVNADAAEPATNADADDQTAPSEVNEDKTPAVEEVSETNAESSE